jgi:hypothetical protein
MGACNRSHHNGRQQRLQVNAPRLCQSQQGKFGACKLTPGSGAGVLKVPAQGIDGQLSRARIGKIIGPHPRAPGVRLDSIRARPETNPRPSAPGLVDASGGNLVRLGKRSSQIGLLLFGGDLLLVSGGTNEHAKAEPEARWHEADALSGRASVERALC